MDRKNAYFCIQIFLFSFSTQILLTNFDIYSLVGKKLDQTILHTTNGDTALFPDINKTSPLFFFNPRIIEHVRLIVFLEKTKYEFNDIFFSVSAFHNIEKKRPSITNIFDFDRNLSKKLFGVKDCGSCTRIIVLSGNEIIFSDGYIDEFLLTALLTKISNIRG